jgi:hypothetical protein
MPGVVMANDCIPGCGLTPLFGMLSIDSVNTASDILDPVKPNYCPLFKNLPQIQIKIFKLTSLSWTLPKPLTKFHINDFYTNSNFMESGFDSFVDDAVVGEQSELAGFQIFW